MNTQEETDADIKDGELFVPSDVTFETSFEIKVDLRVYGDINSRDIYAWDARDIYAWDIKWLVKE